ncbi:MAG: ypdA 5 [Bacteroidetes bacterium]|nr:ypdA 5 [Bacteroidota bacterium]
MRTFFILLSLLFFTASLQAQYPHPAFKQYTVEDGLPSSDVYQVKQDSKGYIWFATGNGVSRFNGYEFENFSMSDGLPDNTVFEIFEDNIERIWFLPISCKLSYYYKGKIYLYKYNDALQKMLKGHIKTSFCVDKNGTVFMGIYHDGIYEIPANGKIKHYPDKAMYGLRIIQPDADHFVYSLKAGRPHEKCYQVEFTTNLIKGGQKIPDDTYLMNATTRVIKSRNNTILLSGNKNLYEFRGLNDFSVEPFNFRIQGIYEDDDDGLWLSTFLGGVYYVHKRDFKNKSCYLQGLAATSVVQDKEGGFWFTTEGNGVFYTPSKKILTYDNASGISNDKINCLATDNAVIYAGTQNGIVYKIKDSIIKIFNINTRNAPVNNISAFYYDDINKRLLIAGKIESGSIKNDVLKEDVGLLEFGYFNDITGSPGNVYYIACSGGVYHRKMNVPAFINRSNYIITPKRVNAIIRSKKNTLLTGEVDGLWEYDLDKKTHIFLGDKNKLLAGRVLSLAYTSDSMLAIGTKGAGLLVAFDDNVYQINKNNKLCGDNVYKVFCEGNNIWVATDNGLNQVTITGTMPFKYNIKSYTTSDGIASNEVNSALKVNGKIWAATNKGLSVFEPGNVFTPATKIPLYITKIMINDSVQATAKKYDLTYSQNNIKIDFTGLGYKNAGKLQYRYKMEGLDTSWTYSQNRQVQYTTLPPNNYYFHLSVLNSNGEWNESNLRINFVIRYPFWQKWWFRAGVFAVLLTMAFLLFRYRVNLVKKQEAKNSELNKTFLNLKLKALRAQMNPHFTFNVMNSIQHFILNQDNEAAQRYLSKFSRLIRSILNNSENNVVLIAEEIKGLELYLELEAMRFEHRFAYEINIDPQIDILHVEIPSMLIQPYVENAIKHGILPLKENGKIKIGIIKEGPLLKCVIEDNGIGRKKAGENNMNRQHRSMGTSLTKERLTVINELHNSKLSETIIDLYDENGNAAGTRIEIHVPIN